MRRFFGLIARWYFTHFLYSICKVFCVVSTCRDIVDMLVGCCANAKLCPTRQTCALLVTFFLFIGRVQFLCPKRIGHFGCKRLDFGWCLGRISQLIKACCRSLIMPKPFCFLPRFFCSSTLRLDYLVGRIRCALEAFLIRSSM